MKRIITAIGVAIFGLSAITAEPAAATTNLPQSIAIMSVITNCGNAGDGLGWGATFHLYSSFDGGLMRITASNFPGWWNPQMGVNISSDSYFTSLHDISGQSATVTVNGTLRITQTTWPGGVVYRSAQITAHRPGC